MSYISKTTLPSNNTYDFKAVLQTVNGTQTSNTASWTGTLNVEELADGLTIAYYLPRTSSSNVTLNLTLAGGTTTGAIPVYFVGNTRMGTQYVAGSIIVLTYWSAGSIKINGTATTDNRWIANSYTDTNNNDKVKQSTKSDNVNYDVLLSYSANAGEETNVVNKDSGHNITYNPSTDTLTVPGVSATTINGVTVGNDPKFTDTTYTNGTGLSLNGTEFSHSAPSPSPAKSTQAIYPVKIDSMGHIIAVGTAFTPGAVATKGVDTSITSSATDANVPTSKAVYDYVSSLPQAMIFKGTVGDSASTSTIVWANLPTPSSSGTSKNSGWTYKALTARTTTDTPTLSQNVNAGDTIISDGSKWVVIPSGDEPSGTVTSVTVTGSSGLTGSGTVTTSGTITLSHADTSSASSISGQSGKFVNTITVDDFGHVTAMDTDDVVVTDENVKQTAVTDNKDYRVLLSTDANDTSPVTGIIHKNTDLKYNPSTKNLMVNKINGSTVGSSPKFTDTNTTTTVSYDKANGTGTFTQSVSTNGGTATETGIFTATHDSFSVDGVGTFSQGSLPSLTVSTKHPLATASIANTVDGSNPVKFTVANECLTITAGTLSVSTTTMDVGSSSGWSAGSLPSLTKSTVAKNIVTSIDKVTT